MSLYENRGDSVLSAATKLSESQGDYLIRGLAGGVSATLAVLAGYWSSPYYWPLVARSVATAFFFPVFGAAGAVLFYWRQHYRLQYGVFEVLIGVAAAWYAAVHSPSGILFERALQLSAGLYIVVRGLDNVDKAIDQTRFARRWSRWFRPS